MPPTCGGIEAARRGLPAGAQHTAHECVRAVVLAHTPCNAVARCVAHLPPRMRTANGDEPTADRGRLACPPTSLATMIMPTRTTHGCNASVMARFIAAHDRQAGPTLSTPSPSAVGPRGDVCHTACAHQRALTLNALPPHTQVMPPYGRRVL